MSLLCRYLLLFLLIFISCAKEEESGIVSLDAYSNIFTKKIIPANNGFWLVSSQTQAPVSMVSSAINYTDGLAFLSGNLLHGKEKLGTILDTEISGENLIVLTPSSVLSFDQQIESTELYTAKTGENFKLMATDSQGKLWILSNKALFTLNGDSVALPRDIYSTDFEIAKDHSFWLASADTIYHIDSTSTFKYPVPEVTGQHSNASFYSLKIDKNGLVWVNTSQNLFQFKNNTWINSATGTYSSDNFKTIPFLDLDSKGNIWIAERNYQEFTNLHKWDGSAWHNYKLNPAIVTWINDIEYAEPGYIWLATYSGLQKIQVSD